MKVELYTIPDCIWCTKSEQLLKMANITDYEKYVIGENDVTFDWVRNKFPFASGYPIIVVDNKVIPGIIELAKLFLEKGLIGSKKK